MPAVPTFQGDSAAIFTNVALLLLFIALLVVAVYTLILQKQSQVRLDNVESRQDRQGAMLTSPLTNPAPSVQASGPVVVQQAPVAPPADDFNRTLPLSSADGVEGD